MEREGEEVPGKTKCRGLVSLLAWYVALEHQMLKEVMDRLGASQERYLLLGGIRRGASLQHGLHTSFGCIPSSANRELDAQAYHHPNQSS